MKRIIIPSSITLMLLFLACITDSSEEYEYDSIYRIYEKTLTAEIDQIFYNGFLKDYDTILCPYEYSEDGFYLVESPEMLDSIFQEINYPGIDSLFPENGVLLILWFSLPYHMEVAGNVFFFTDSTLKADVTIREWIYPELGMPGCYQYVFPVGVTFK